MSGIPNKMEYSDAEIVASVMSAGGNVEVISKMCEWIQNELYSELLAMPLWTLSAFGQIDPKTIIKPDDVKYKLIVYLVLKHMGRSDCPYDSDHRHNWKVSEYIPMIKVAAVQCRKVLSGFQSSE